MSLNRNQHGAINPLALALVVSLLIMVGLGAAAVNYYGRYVDHRDNVDAKVSQAVQTALTKQENQLRAEFAEENKRPYETYTSPAALGSIEVTYPRTWSAYVNEQTSGRNQLDGYFHPGYVPDARSETRFATRMTLETKDYADSVDDYDKDVEKGLLKARAVTVSGVKGIRLDGQIDRDINGALVILPLRDKTLKIWSESPDHLGDFNSVIIDKLVFNP